MSYWTPTERDYNESANCMHGVNQFHFCKECSAIAARRPTFTLCKKCGERLVPEYAECEHCMESNIPEHAA